MGKNILAMLFDAFNKENITYCVRGRYAHLPKTLDGGDVDLLIEKKDFARVRGIIDSKGFIFYPFTEPNYFYYYCDLNLGLIQLDFLLTKRMPKIKKFKNFFIPSDENPIVNQKRFSKKILTAIRRRFYHLLRGKVVCLVGPDGSGKTTNSNLLYETLKKFPIKKKRIHFGTLKPSALYRSYNRILNIGKTYFNNIVGKLTITDRYIYLTFRKNRSILRKLIRFVAPTPDIVFVMKADYKTLKKRKEGQKDCLDEKLVKELYQLFNEIEGTRIVEINTSKSIRKNVTNMTNMILRELYKKV